MAEETPVRFRPGGAVVERGTICWLFMSFVVLPTGFRCTGLMGNRSGTLRFDWSASVRYCIPLLDWSYDESSFFCEGILISSADEIAKDLTSVSFLLSKFFLLSARRESTSVASLSFWLRNTGSVGCLDFRLFCSLNSIKSRS